MMLQSSNVPAAPRPAVSGHPAQGLLAGLPQGLGVDFSYDHGEEIFGEAEPTEFVYRVVKGVVRTYRTLSDGRRQINAFHVAGDIFGLDGETEHQLSAEAVTDLKVVVYKRRSLERLAEQNIVVARGLWGVAARELREAGDHMLLLGRKGAVERVAGFLLAMAVKTGRPDAVELAMGRRDIADYLGLTIETVSRSFTHLQEVGLVELCGARQVTLLNRRGLQELEA